MKRVKKIPYIHDAWVQALNRIYWRDRKLALRQIEAPVQFQVSDQLSRQVRQELNIRSLHLDTDKFYFGVEP